jgi:hypothetical protein
MRAKVIKYLERSQPNNPDTDGAFAHITETDHWWLIAIYDDTDIMLVTSREERHERQRMLLRSERTQQPYLSVAWSDGLAALTPYLD